MVDEAKQASYYLIYGRVVGKRVHNTEFGTDYLYKDGEWVPDTGWVIRDHLCGFDPSEPPGSPYGFGSTDIKREIKEISAEEAEGHIAAASNNEIASNSEATEKAGQGQDETARSTPTKQSSPAKPAPKASGLYGASNTPKVWALLEEAGFELDSYCNKEALMAEHKPILIDLGSKQIVGIVSVTTAYHMSQAGRILRHDKLVELYKTPGKTE